MKLPAGLDLASDRLIGGCGVCAEFRQRLAEIGKRPQLFRKLHGPLGQAGKVFVNTIDQLVAKSAACLGIKVEGHWCI